MKGFLELNEDNFNPEVTRLYVTRGDNLFNHDGVKCDKFTGLEINNQIYWMNLSFANVKQLSGTLKKAVRNPYANDSLWWTPSDLRQHFKHTQA